MERWRKGWSTVGAVAVATLTPVSCAAGDPVRIAQERIEAVKPSPSPIDRPSLRGIFRDGRFRFRPAGAGLQRRLEAAVRRDPVLRGGVEKVVAKVVVDPKGRRDPMYAVAIVWNDSASQNPENWAGFINGAEDAGVELEQSAIAGANVAYGEAKGDQMLAIDYARDLLIRLAAQPSTPREDLEAVARYLLEA